MRKVEFIDEELLIIRQSLDLYKEKIQLENARSAASELKTIEEMVKKLKHELNKTRE
ncbi:MAG: hypothetical protein H7Y18_03085 [Clostridiaceae bacterium]|nr:hypothetical protein [Clostridiaceae bacterium]